MSKAFTLRSWAASGEPRESSDYGRGLEEFG